MMFGLAISAAVIVAGAFFDYRFTEKAAIDRHEKVERIAGSIARRMASHIETEFAMADGLMHAVDRNGRPSVRFNAFASKVLHDAPMVAAIGIAPNFTVDAFKTRTRGPASLGEHADTGGTETLRNYDKARLAAALSGLAGRSRPVLLSEAQDAYLTLVTPILNPDDMGAVPQGAIVMLIDKTAALTSVLSSANGVPAPIDELRDLSWLDISLVDRSLPGQPTFIGPGVRSGEQPIRWALATKGVDWVLYTAPRDGWDVTPPNQLRFRLALLLAGLAVICPVLLATSLISERNSNIAALRMREANLMMLSQRFNLAMHASNMGIWEVLEGGTHLYWDERAAGLHGMPPDGYGNRMAEWLETIVVEDRVAAEAHFFNCISMDEASDETYRVILTDGSRRYLRSAGASYMTEDGRHRTTGVVWDVTADVVMTQTLRNAKENGDIKNAELELALDELSEREHQLEELSTTLELALASSGCGIWQYDPGTGEELWDRRMCELYGVPYTGNPLPQNFWFEQMLPEDRAKAADVSRAYLTGNVDEPLVVRLPQPDGSIRYIRSVGQLQIGKDGSRKLIGLALDITKDALMTADLKLAKQEADAKNAELELAKTEIEHNALHDPLTRLANRRKLDQELDKLTRLSQTSRLRLSILHLDLDRFKQINDTLGHAAGDAMLAHAADILRNTVRPGDLVARIGGDEFVILAQDYADSDQVAEMAARIVAELHQPIDFEGFSCRCGVSIGIAQAAGAKIDARRLLVNADLALYRAKAQGRNCFEFFTQNLQAEIINHKRTADEVLSAIENDEFVTYYQPQFSARTGEFSGAEALIRWNHPIHGILPPGRFLKIAEDLNVTAQLDQLVLETVLRNKLRWKALGLNVPKVSVNVSAKRLHEPGLLDTLTSLQIQPGEISFELVESIFLDDSEELASGDLERIKALGIDIEIDDFGTGHTSIVSLLKLKPRRLKIDRQLVMPILHSPQENALVRSIIDIARSLGVETVAEGVETMNHAAVLGELGCDTLQGYAFGHPLPFDEFTARMGSGWLKVAA